MYYKSVNRGLTFTKAGIYCIGYVMLVGLLAIVSGVNALYLFLSTGMALLIVSGLLSERVMKITRVISIGSRFVNADTPFHLPFSVKNTAQRFTTYGLETYFFLQKIKMPFIARPIDAPLEGNAIKIAPGETRTFDAQCKGLPRGHYDQLICLQKTGYPFGFLEKFKFKDLSCDITVAPRIDEELLEKLCRELNTFRRQTEDRMEFFAHRGYSTLDSLRHIDWRRSAAKPSKDWVVKVFRNEIDVINFSIALPTHLLNTAESEVAYEYLLCRVRTAVEAIRISGFQLSLKVTDTTSVRDLKEILRLLAKFPKFVDRSSIQEFLNTIPGQAPSPNDPELTIGNTDYGLQLPGRRAS